MKNRMLITLIVVINYVSVVHGKEINKKVYGSSKFLTTQEKSKRNQKDSIISKNLVIKELINNMVMVAGGSFIMGCSNEQEKNCDKDENPAHSVKVSDFKISKFEVTRSQWLVVMGKSRFKIDSCNRCAVDSVSWNEIQIFIKKLNKMTGKHFRLPTEAEWEFAARGGILSKGFVYSGSNELDSIAWYDQNSSLSVKQVGQKKSNELGLFDMSGNVWEWCSDWFGENYYSESNVENPKGPLNGKDRVVRGGSWIVGPRNHRVSYRARELPNKREKFIGFRLVDN